MEDPDRPGVITTKFTTPIAVELLNMLREKMKRLAIYESRRPTQYVFFQFLSSDEQL